MTIYATTQALEAWQAIVPATARARSLAATHFAPCKADGDDAEYKKQGVKALVKAAELEAFYPYWSQFVGSLSAAGAGRTISATLQSRLLINMSGSILENAGIALEHVCGVPIIPGSAVKGAARRYAVALLQECDDAQQKALLDTFISIFGCVEKDFEPGSDLVLAMADTDWLHTQAKRYGNRRGRVCFLQAVPQQKIPLCMDVLTPHHSKYMDGSKTTPEDTEDPTPCYFPAVDYGEQAVYTFALYAPGCPELLDTAAEWLGQALTLFGIGAKGAAGYGYFAIAGNEASEFTPEQLKAIKEIADASPGKISKMFAAFFKEHKSAPVLHWALLRAVALPQDSPHCRLNDLKDYINKPAVDKKQERARRKLKETMQELAAEYNIELPPMI